MHCGVLRCTGVAEVHHTKAVGKKNSYLKNNLATNLQLAMDWELRNRLRQILGGIFRQVDLLFGKQPLVGSCAGHCPEIDID